MAKQGATVETTNETKTAPGENDATGNNTDQPKVKAGDLDEIIEAVDDEKKDNEETGGGAPGGGFDFESMDLDAVVDMIDQMQCEACANLAQKTNKKPAEHFKFTPDQRAKITQIIHMIAPEFLMLLLKNKYAMAAFMGITVFYGQYRKVSDTKVE